MRGDEEREGDRRQREGIGPAQHTHVLRGAVRSDAWGEAVDQSMHETKHAVRERVNWERAYRGQG